MIKTWSSDSVTYNRRLYAVQALDQETAGNEAVGHAVQETGVPWKRTALYLLDDIGIFYLVVEREEEPATPPPSRRSATRAGKPKASVRPASAPSG